MLVVYGIKTCDSVKKARIWLEQRQIPYRFHDFRSDGLDAELLQGFLADLGEDAVLNRRSSSWRQLDEARKSDLTLERLQALLLEIPTLIKRPIVADADGFCIGLDPQRHQPKP